MELVNFVKGLTEVMDFTREVLIERSGLLVQSGQILPHGAGKLCEGSVRGGGLHQGGGWQEVLI